MFEDVTVNGILEMYVKSSFFINMIIWAYKVKVKVSVAQLCPTLCDPWTVARQAPLSMGFSRQECWSGLPLPSPGGIPDPGVEPGSPELQADSFTV